MPRPPVVTVMGHVDHGKTSLLDYDPPRPRRQPARPAGSRSTSGPITSKRREGRDHLPRHAGPRGVHGDARPRRQGRPTSSMLVVAADDGVMPQTKEAVHARQGGQRAHRRRDEQDGQAGSQRPDRLKSGAGRRGCHSRGVRRRGRSSSRCRRSPARESTSSSTQILLQAEVLELKASVRTRRRRASSSSRSLDKGKGPGGHGPGPLGDA